MLLWTWGCRCLFKAVISFALDIYPEVALLDHMAVLLKNFWGASILFSTVAALIYTPTNSAQRLPFLYSLTNICCLIFLIIAILIGDVSLWFWFVFLWWLIMLCTFHVPVGHLYVFFGKNVYSNLFSIFNQIFFLLNCMSSLYLLDINPSSGRWFSNIFSHSVGCLFILLIVSSALQKESFSLI